MPADFDIRFLHPGSSLGEDRAAQAAHVRQERRGEQADYEALRQAWHQCGMDEECLPGDDRLYDRRPGHQPVQGRSGRRQLDPAKRRDEPKYLEVS